MFFYTLCSVTKFIIQRNTTDLVKKCPQNPLSVLFQVIVAEVVAGPWASASPEVRAWTLEVVEVSVYFYTISSKSACIYAPFLAS